MKHEVDVDAEPLPIAGFGVGGYRSIKDLQLLGPLAKVTLLAGRNNVGKSNILRFLRDHYNACVSNASAWYEPPKAYTSTINHRWRSHGEVPIGVKPHMSFAVMRQANDRSQELEALAKVKISRGQFNNTQLGMQRIEAAVAEVHERLGLEPSQRGLWRMWAETGVAGSLSDSQWNDKLSEAAEPVARELAQTFGARVSGIGLSRALIPAKPELLEEIVFVPAFRQLSNPEKALASTADSDEDRLWSGEGIIDLLGDLSNPPSAQREEMTARWEAFVDFVREVIDEPKAILRVPRKVDELLIFADGRELNVLELGTGIHEVVIIAAAATAKEHTLFLLEEPEIHLHPILQKRLINYLAQHTSNQYIIATHSAHILDTPDAAVLSVGLEDGWTVVKPAITNADIVRTIGDLGYRPSDLLQTNAVVWVEGPSDRIYLEYWLSLLEEPLTLGVDLTIMHYGGSLISHLSGEDTEYDAGETSLVELLRINRRSAVILDSDKANKDDQLKSTVARISEEFGGPSSALWITDGREVENYLKPAMVAAAIAKVHPQICSGNTPMLDGADKWSRLWRYRIEETGDWREADKVKIARKIVEQRPLLKDFHQSAELTKRLEGLADFIRTGASRPLE